MSGRSATPGMRWLASAGRSAAGGALAMLLGAQPVAADPFPVAVLRGLDKVTARSSVFRVPVGEPVRFGTLEIVARICDKRPPEETPESAAFLEIQEIKRAGKTMPLFSGWMFASSPGLSALEHPIYDVWVLDCAASDDSSTSSSSAGGSQ